MKEHNEGKNSSLNGMACLFASKRIQTVFYKIGHISNAVI